MKGPVNPVHLLAGLLVRRSDRAWLDLFLVFLCAFSVSFTSPVSAQETTQETTQETIQDSGVPSPTVSPARKKTRAKRTARSAADLDAAPESAQGTNEISTRERDANASLERGQKVSPPGERTLPPSPGHADPGTGLGGSAKLTFKQTLQMAMERSLDLKTLQYTSQNADLTAKNAWAAIFPSADLQATHQYARFGLPGNDVPGVTYPWANSAAVNFAEKLYDNGESFRQIEIQDLNRKIQKLSYDRGVNSLLENVTSAYFDFSFNAGSLDLQRSQLDTLRQQLRQIENRYHAGQTSNRDYLRIKAQVQRADLAILSQELSLESSRSALRLAMGVGESVDFVPYRPEEGLIKDLKFDDVKPEQSFEFQIATLQDQVSDITFRSAQRAYYPRLTANITSSYVYPQYFGNRDGIPAPYWDFNAGLTLDYNLWDWGQLRRKVDIASNQRGIDKAAQEKIRITVEQALSTLREQVKALQKSYSLSQEILRADEEAFVSLNRAYREGKVNYLELVTGLSDLYNSRTQYLTTEFSMLKAQINLAFYEGRVYETIERY